MEHSGTPLRAAKTLETPGTARAHRVPVPRWYLTLALVLGGCIATPQPDPPSLSPDGLSAPASDRAGDRSVVGEAGSVRAGPGASVAVAVLDGALPIAVGPVEDDGSFVIPGVRAGEGHELRLWVRDGDARSAPLDLIVNGIDLVPAERALTCLTSMPEHTLELEAAPGETATGSITLTSACAEEVSIEVVALRAPNAAFTVEPAPPSASPSAELVVRFTATAGADVEEVLLITVAGAERDRRPITIRGVARE